MLVYVIRFGNLYGNKRRRRSKKARGKREKSRVRVSVFRGTRVEIKRIDIQQIEHISLPFVI